MSNTEDITTSEAAIPVAKTHTNGPPSFTRTPIKTLTDRLQSLNLIGTTTRIGFNNTRTVQLKTQDIYDALVNLYRLHFASKWYILSPVLSPHYRNQTADKGAEILAQVYISHWFVDLYNGIRDALRKHPLTRFTDHYSQELGIESTTYDNYLTLLMNNLKPTRLHGWIDNSLFIPVIHKEPNFENTVTRNYFYINRFNSNDELFSALIDAIKNPTFGWQLSTPANDALGRPFWLLDWHAEKAYAWFPEEDNYNKDDLNLAFILGVACTPHLALRDDDIPRQYAGNTFPADNIIFKHKRHLPPQFPSNFDVRIVEDQCLNTSWPVPLTPSEQKEADEIARIATETQIQAEVIRMKKKRTATALALTESDTTTSELVPQSETDRRLYAEASARINKVRPQTHKINTHLGCMYKIVDYKYYAKVIRKIDDNTRTAAHKILIYQD